ncbi:hypothetical protein PSPO01_16495 [Paraphaeosphaeria sporulosa]
MNRDLRTHRVPPPLRVPPFVLFRTECHDRNSNVYNSTFLNSDIVSRACQARLKITPVTRNDFDDCLSWQKVNTSLIPFTISWDRAMQRRQWLIQGGMKRIVIVAIWTKDLRNVYDASEVAEWLGYKNDGKDKRRQIRHHYDEYLIYGGISADEYRLLTVFDGQQEKEVTLGIPGLVGSTIVPATFPNGTPEATVQEELQNAIYLHTGIKGESAQLWYLIGSMIRAFELPWISFVIKEHRKSEKVSK